jgi:hypothetical protein|tara:strand:+ start:608 stop:787 length:180 start_codon:yes stop_codon:yes gene_type:complete
MYDLQSYLGKMSSGFVTEKKIKQSKFGKPKKKKRNKVSSQANFHQQFHVSWKITEDDLP